MVVAAVHGRPPGVVCSRLLAVLGLMLGVTTNSIAQTAADHAAQAHGHPIVNGKDIQPTPRVVEERLRHHRQMLQAEHDEVAGSAVKRPVGRTATQAKTPNNGRQR